MKLGAAVLTLMAIIATSACTQSTNTLRPSPALNQEPTPTHQLDEPATQSSHFNPTLTPLYSLLTRWPTRTPTPRLVQPLPADWRLTEEETFCMKPLLPYKVIRTTEELEKLRECSTKESIRMLTHLSQETYPNAHTGCLTDNGILQGFSYFQELIENVQDPESRFEWALAFLAATTVTMTSCSVNRELEAMGFSEEQKMVLDCVHRNTDSGTQLITTLILGEPSNAISIYDQAVRTCAADPFALWTDSAPGESKTLYLSEEEKDCLRPLDPFVIYFGWFGGNPGRDSALAVRACLENESLRLITYVLDVKGLENYVGNSSLQLEDIPTICIAQPPVQAWVSNYFRTAYSEETQYEYAIALIGTWALASAACYPNDFLAAMGAGPKERETLKCVVKETRNTAEIAALMLAGSAPQALARFDEAYSACREES